MPIEIERIKIEIKDTEDNIGNIKAIDYSGMPGAPNHTGDPTADAVINKEKKLAKLNYRLRMQELQKKLIDMTLSQLDADLKRLFNAQYVTNCRDSKSNIARRLCISRKKYYTDKDKLVDIFRNVLENYEAS
jgi:hypothetical protein